MPWMVFHNKLRLALPFQTRYSVEAPEELYSGMLLLPVNLWSWSGGRRYYLLSERNDAEHITAIGKWKMLWLLRSGATSRDIICVTGNLGLLTLDRRFLKEKNPSTAKVRKFNRSSVVWVFDRKNIKTGSTQRCSCLVWTKQCHSHIHDRYFRWFGFWNHPFVQNNRVPEHWLKKVKFRCIPLQNKRPFSNPRSHHLRFAWWWRLRIVVYGSSSDFEAIRYMPDVSLLERWKTQERRHCNW